MEEGGEGGGEGRGRKKEMEVKEREKGGVRELVRRRVGWAYARACC